MLASSTSQPPDTIEQLIEGCLQGDQQAWSLIVTRYRRKVFNVAYKFVGRHDVAEDLTQEIFLKIFKALGTFDQRANLADQRQPQSLYRPLSQRTQRT